MFKKIIKWFKPPKIEDDESAIKTAAEHIANPEKAPCCIVSSDPV